MKLYICLFSSNLIVLEFILNVREYVSKIYELDYEEMKEELEDNCYLMK